MIPKQILKLYALVEEWQTIMLANENIVLFAGCFCVITFGLLCTKYSPFSTSTSESWQQQLISSMAGEKLAHRLPFVIVCTCQRTANHQQLAVAAMVNCSLQSCYLDLHFKRTCTHILALEVTYQFQKHWAGNHNYFLVAWNSRVLKFGQHSPLVFQ